MMIDELKTATDIVPDEHDGSYELVRETVKSLATVPPNQIDVNDFDLLYSMAIGTWKIGVEKKAQRIDESHLSEVEKTKLTQILDKVKTKSIQHYYKDNVTLTGDEWFIGMFGTGFQTLQTKADQDSAQRFISLCIDLLNMNDTEAMFVKVENVFAKGIKGMQSAAASVVLHCLKPYIFPIINSGMDDTIINQFKEIGVLLNKPKDLKTYIKNSRLLMTFRDENCIFKNYRVLDLIMFKNIKKDGQKIWTFSSGEKALKWDEFKNEGIMAIGWDEIGDIENYKSKKDIKDKLNQLYGSKSSHANDSHALWQFKNDIKIGDYIIAKKGSKTILGLGVVTSDYSFDNNRNDYKHTRKVEWVKVGQWNTEDKFAIKTLTDVTAYKEFHEKILNIINNVDSDNIQKNDIIISKAQFIRWFAPIISALKQLDGQGTPSKVCEIIANDLSLDGEYVNQKGGKFNQNIFKNQVAWARQYLIWAGLLDGSEYGIWKLTDAGYKVDMTDEIATEILKNKDKIDSQIEINNDSPINYWWLNANPNEWSFSNIEIGKKIDFTSTNANGNKRQIYKNFEDAKVGDIVIGYESGSTKAIIAICKISKTHDGERLWLEKVKNLVTPIKWSELIEIEEFKNKKFQGTLFKLSQEEYNVITNLIANERIINIPLKSYSEQDFLEEVFIAPDDYKEIKFLIQTKKNIILQGAPGVGKTFAAKRLAYSLIGEKDNSRIEMVQFHQNYSYEDFVMGYRPVDGGGFELRNGCFHNFCIKASNDPENAYYFIIDEINRGNLSKIFGELLMLIECDKRGISYAVPLTYKPDTRFYVPENVHIIGMMNTADRSLAMIDYALRRRFCFVEMEPAFLSDQFKEYLKSKNVDPLLIDKIIKQMSDLNKAIEPYSNLGRGFRIGHSYFCNLPENADESWYRNVIKYEIIPLLEEYWFDDDEEVKKHKTKLQG